jgi:hypothetical protein
MIRYACFVLLSIAQTQPAPPAAPPAPPAAPAAAAVPSREELEKRFTEELTGTTLVGVWQMTGPGGLTGAANLTDPKPDEYNISKVVKVTGDNWLIHARIRYADKDVTIPVPVRVLWAEDTAIITLNDLTMPLLGTYSARVMIHHGFYSGVWYCGEKNYGGVMQGRITKGAANPPAAHEAGSK